jgi:hypothetical protein
LYLKNSSVTGVVITTSDKLSKVVTGVPQLKVQFHAASVKTCHEEATAVGMVKAYEADVAHGWTVTVLAFVEFFKTICHVFVLAVHRFKEFVQVTLIVENAGLAVFETS